MTQIWQKVLVACVLLGSTIVFQTCQLHYLYETYTVSIRHEIERTILVKGMENKFSHVEGMGLGGAGTGGLGAPQVFVASTAQFLELVPSGEHIYTTYEVGSKSRGRYALVKVYWAFIENRAGLLIYEDVYDVREIRPLLKGERYRSIHISHDDETVTFQVSIRKWRYEPKE